jgi:hypothetical protein
VQSNAAKDARVTMARGLLERGWRLILLMSSVKVPVAREWQLFKKPPRAEAFGALNCGVLTDGEFFVLDVDVKPGAPNGHESLRMLEQMHGKLPETLQVSTPSGGAHYYFKHPKDAKVGCKKLSYNGLFLGCETKGVGGFVVCPPSTLDNGTYDWVDCDETTPIAEAPEWLLGLVRPPTEAKRQAAVESQSQDKQHVMSLLGHVSPDCDYEEWLRIGMALHSSGEPWGYEVWLEWSRTGRKFKGEADLQHRWNGFKPGRGVSMGTLFHICGQYIEEPERVYAFETSAIAPRIFDEPEVVQAKKSSEIFREVAEQSQGMLRELNDYFYSTSICPDHPFTFAAALTLCHFAVQGEFVTHGGDILHQFSLCDGASASGKTSSFSATKRLAQVMRKDATLKHPTSLKGLIREFQKETCRMWVYDEWGGPEVIKAFKGDDKHQGEIYRQGMLGLWSTADCIEGTSQADPNNDAPTVHGPRLSVLFSTQSDTVERLGSTGFYRTSGFARRMDIFKGDANPMPRDVDSADKRVRTENIIASLLDWKAWLEKCLPTDEFQGRQCFEVGMSSSVQERRHLLRVECHNRAEALGGENDTQVQILKTAVQKCTRWATVHALSRRSRVVEDVDWNYATALFDAVHHSFTEMESGKNSAYERARVSVLAYLRKGPMSARDLKEGSWSFKALERMDRKELLADLMDNGEVFAKKDGKRTAYHLVR